MNSWRVAGRIKFPFALATNSAVWGLCFCVCIISCLPSFPSVSPCVCVCVAGGVAAPELQPIKHTCTQFIPITLSLKAWSSLHSDAGLLLLHAFVWCFPTRLFMLIASRIYQPATTLPFQPVFCLSCSPCRSSRYSASPAHPAVPAGILPLLLTLPFQPVFCLFCSPCRSSRYLPPLLTLPFQPESTSPELINFVKFLSSLVRVCFGVQT